MAHHFESGFTVRQKSWHGLETVLSDAPETSREAIVAAGMDWPVEEQPLYAERLTADGVVTMPITTHKAIVRGTDQSVLGIVGSDWRPLQNVDAFRFFDPIVADKAASFETAGSLKGGKVVWVLAKINMDRQAVAGNDEILPYLLLSNSHDGSRAVTVAFTPIRVVCWNTLSASLGRSDAGTIPAIRVLHMSTMEATLREVQGAIDLARSRFAVSMERFESMRARGLQADEFKRYVVDVLRGTDEDLVAMIEAAQVQASFGISKAADRVEALKRKAAAEPRAVEIVTDLFERGPGADLAGQTVWGAYNAVTHYVDHVRGKSQENRMESSWFGGGARTRQVAFKKAMELVGS